MDEEIKSITISTLKKLIGDFDINTLEIKFYQSFKDRYDIYGKFQNKDGVYEFAISVDKKGNIKRDHINLISPRKVVDEINKKVHSE
ncbi:MULTISPECIES: hypothetical protein [Sulfurisphaera]|uniref:Uncharacterized protein n=3 Tax=Sulfurisphaera TaxID=69655 RepID=F9VMQ4_SULTO|nr:MULTISPECIES: hypothetical protein [Sulfurisphaera]MBB5253238.1 hypothetical protein [Sulfurisphaera ohwakuensis]QGR15855.1 hypothetical protein D1869_00600 [Sulfurisphaera ohwakuensis]BAK54200.1 hypothetical protein STK_02185 [Sulfurisphaera tokodaii str. 7]HII74340.1 hypothetical protein [Sulfurisphaera tokodaii]